MRTASGPAGPAGAPLLLHLPFRQPLCPDNLFGHLAATAVPGVEEVRDGRYRRTVRLPHGPGVIDLSPTPDRIVCRLSLSDLRDLTTAIARCRRLLDLDADPLAVDGHLGGDPVLAPIVAKAPGRRVPRCIDGAEMAVRAVLGQHVSVAAARTATATLVTRCGDRCVDPAGGLTHLFPEPAAVSAEAVGLPAARRQALVALTEALTEGRVTFGPGSDRQAELEELAQMPGVGPWTVQTVAMRALGDPDAFPAGDLGVRRAASRARDSRIEAGARSPGRGVAPVACLCRPVPLGDDRPRGEPLAAGRWPGTDPLRLPLPADGFATPDDRSPGHPADQGPTDQSSDQPTNQPNSQPKDQRRPMTTVTASPTTYTTTVTSPIGRLTLAWRDGALTGLHMEEQRHAVSADPSWVRDDDRFDDVSEQLRAYFAGQRSDFDVPIRFVGTPFQMEVWSALRDIPFGETISYAELARRVGRPGAFRAVGGANGRNPVAVIVPCHRVVAADGTLGGYGGGLDRKRWLLDLEGASGRWTVGT